MEREIITTQDGSKTIRIKNWDECYHSKHGAIQEAQHVFIKNGLALFENKEVAVMEIGFGTGLNSFITFIESKKMNQSINYVGVEAFPISKEELEAMNYVDELKAKEYRDIFNSIHENKWNETIAIDSKFSLQKRLQLFSDIDDLDSFDLIYFDAFGYRVQPELWSTDIFKKMYDALKNDGILVTYAARGVIKRSMIEVGFTVEKLAGPPGKREMFRASKTKIAPYSVY